MNVLVLVSAVDTNAAPDEEDTLVQAAAVTAALRRMGHTVRSSPFLSEVTREQLLADAPDFVFNLVESVRGKGELAYQVPELLSELKIPFTGCDGTSLRLSNDKAATKDRLTEAGIASPPFLLASADAAQMEGLAAGKYIVKARHEDASIGLEEDSVFKVAHAADLLAEIRRRSANSGIEHFAERFVDGREFNVALIAGHEGLEVLPVAEILFHDFPPYKERIIGYRAKWDVDSFEYHHTPRSYQAAVEEPELCRKLSLLAVRSCELLALVDYVRVDFRVDEMGECWVLEVNAGPCIAPDSGFCAAAYQAGLSYEQMIARISARACASAAAQS
jgi:D-alanine-D-alanine ligase